MDIFIHNQYKLKLFYPMSSVNQPDFWLEIRKEYIIENFEKLLNYVRRYQFITPRDSGEFVTTCRYLIDLAEELSEYSLTRTFLETQEFKLKDSDMVVPDSLAIRIMVAAIIAAQKVGKERQILLLRVINLLVTSHKMPQTDILQELVEVISNCVRRSPIVNLGMTWSDIDNPDTFSASRLLHNICRTKFDVASGSDSVFEGKGTVVFSSGLILGVPVNKTDFSRLVQTGSLVEFLSPSPGVRIMLPKSDHMRSPETVEGIADSMTFLSRAHTGVKPSISESKRKYAAGSIITVKIKSCWGVKIEAQTVDPDFEPIFGKVNINIAEVIRYADIFHILPMYSPGKLLKVEYTPDDREFPFTLSTAFAQYYHEFADQMRGESMPGVYIGDYSAGTQWLSEDGFVVNVMGKVDNDDVRYAMDTHVPLSVRINSTKDSNGTILVNGSLVDDIDLYGLPDPVDDFETYKHDCLAYLFGEFMDYCQDFEKDLNEPGKLSEVDGEGAQVLANVLMEHQKLLSDTMPRLISLLSALSLSTTAEEYTVSAFIRHELDYQIAVAKFAGGASPMSITISHGPILDGNHEVESHERIIARIRN